MSKPFVLTARQRTLFDRLVTLGNWATAGKFPFRITEILGFGSFFRGKSTPRDVDLVLRVQRPDYIPQFARFIELLNEIRSDPAFQNKFSGPREALLDVLKRRSGKLLPGFEDSDRSPALYGSWLEGYSWSMLFPRTIHAECAITSPDGFARRLLRREFPISQRRPIRDTFWRSATPFGFALWLFRVAMD